MTSHGPHRKKVKHYHEPGDLHELTFSCFQRRPLLTNDDWRRRLSISIDNACSEHRFELAAFVYMPEHVHLLVFPLEKKPDIGKFLAAIKNPFSAEIKEILEKRPTPLLRKLTVQERPGKAIFRFWQEGPGYDRNLTRGSGILHSIEYLHLNPVRRSLCDQAVKWPWSSARYYSTEPQGSQFPGLPFIHGLRPEALL
jgi:putative transposase